MRVRDRQQPASIVCLTPLLLVVCNVAAARTVDECCRSHNLPEACVRSLCYPLNPPGEFDVYDVFGTKNNCSKHFPEIAQCLADGRHHHHCCKSEAADPEEDACFGLCEGMGKVTKTWKEYQRCLVINLPTMFTCFEKGYVNTPSPPVNPRLDSIDTTAVTLRWEAPEQNRNKVTLYKVIVVEQQEASPKHHKVEEEGENGEALVFLEGRGPKQLETEVVGSTSARVENLIPGTLYNAHVIAVGSSPTERSLSSDMLDFQTVGIPPRVQPYKDATQAPLNAKSVVLACRFYMSSVSQSTAELTWQHRGSNDNDFASVGMGPRFNFSHYIAAYDRPREYMMMLQIRDLKESDFGTYRCGVSDKYGKASSELQLAVAAVHVASNRPPDTPIDCCRERGVEERCMSMCGAVDGGGGKRYIPRPYMPFNCSIHISKVLSCAMPGIDDGGCCLMEHVPRPCMYLCDSSVAPSNHMDPLCLQFLSPVQGCRVRGVENRPGSVANLRVQTSAGTDSTIIQWDAAVNAEIYYIYWRRSHDGQWHQKSTVGTSKKVVGGADEIVLVAANSYGISHASRLTVGNSK